MTVGPTVDESAMLADPDVMGGAAKLPVQIGTEFRWSFGPERLAVPDLPIRARRFRVASLRWSVREAIVMSVIKVHYVRRRLDQLPQTQKPQPNSVTSEVKIGQGVWLHACRSHVTCRGQVFIPFTRASV